MPKDAKKENKEKKHFFKDVKTELKRVIWPAPKQLVNNTVAVITIVLITAIIVFVLDFAFESMNKFGIDNIKNVVQSTNTTDDTTTNETTNTIANEQSNTVANEVTSNTQNTTETNAESNTQANQVNE